MNNRLKTGNVGTLLMKESNEQSGDRHLYVQFLDRQSVYSNDDRLKLKPKLVRIPQKHRRSSSTNSPLQKNIRKDKKLIKTKNGVLSLIKKLIGPFYNDLPESSSTNYNNIKIYESKKAIRDSLNGNETIAGNIFEEVSGRLLRTKSNITKQIVSGRKQPFRIYNNYGSAKNFRHNRPSESNHKKKKQTSAGVFDAFSNMAININKELKKSAVKADFLRTRKR